MIDLVSIVATKTAEVLASELTKAALNGASKAFRDRQPYAILDFGPHIQLTYERCTKVKTIVNGDEPIELLHYYVPLEFRKSNKVIDDFTIIENIFRDRLVVISGSAGSGKSIFMRYLWIAYFVEPKGRIPLFIELRNLNSIDSDDLMTFIYHTTIQSSNLIGDQGRSEFQKAVEEGQFIFIFDGFDELNNEKRTIYETQLLALARMSKNVIVISGRPDMRFKGWQSFSTYHVAPLTLDKAVDIVEKIDFERSIKRKFVDKLKGGLYRDHTDFASRPLLLTMMLPTYSSYAEIPEKVHVL